MCYTKSKYKPNKVRYNTSFLKRATSKREILKLSIAKLVNSRFNIENNNFQCLSKALKWGTNKCFIRTFLFYAK